MTHILKIEFHFSQFVLSRDELIVAEKSLFEAKEKLKSLALALPEVKDAARIAFGKAAPGQTSTVSVERPWCHV